MLSYSDMNEEIGSLIRRLESNYISGTTTLSKYVQYSMYETVERIDAYANSKHISGDVDSLGREKPFFNIVTAAINIWYRATDIDRKDIRIRATKKSDEIKAFFATVHLRQWMRKSNFGAFLNEWGRSLARYGSSVVKFIEKDGVLYANVVPWNRLIVDAIDFDNNIKIEKLYLTPEQLLANPKYDQEQVNNLILASKKFRETLSGQSQDALSDYIELYEVHGNMPLSYLTGDDKDSGTQRQQMHVVSYVESTDKDTFDDFSIYKGKEGEDPYMITHLIKEDGRTLSIGAVEHLFEAQWMQNHTIKNEKDLLDLSTKLLFQTSDGNFIGRNILSALETGDILIHKENEPLTQLNNSKADITSLQNFASQWRVLEREVTSTPDATRGINPPSGTPLGTTQLLTGQGLSLFELMTENKGLDIEQMLRRKVIPHIKKKLGHSDEISATLEGYDLKKIDSMYIPTEAVKRFNQDAVNKVLSLDINKPIEQQSVPSPYQQDIAHQQIQKELAPLGNTRYFVPDDMKKIKWSEVFKDFEWDCEVEVTNESVDKQATLTTLSSILQTAQNNPELYKLIMSKILDETGIVSPMEIDLSPQSIVPPQPTLQPTGG